MHPNDQKELYSETLVKAVATVAGFTFSTSVGGPDRDATDGQFATSNDARIARFPKVDAQLKCSSRDLLRPDGVHFPLDVRSYDRLRVDRIVPCVLIVAVVPEDPQEWLLQTDEQLVLRGSAFWTNLRGRPPTANIESITVVLPIENRLSPEAFTNIMTRVSEGHAP